LLKAIAEGANMVVHVGSQTSAVAEIPTDLQELFQDPAVCGIFAGKCIGASLDQDAVGAVTGLRTSDSSMGVVA
jgi:hypothetical protein